MRGNVVATKVWLSAAKNIASATHITESANVRFSRGVNASSID